MTTHIALLMIRKYALVNRFDMCRREQHRMNLSSNAARMIDVSMKPPTERTATAEAIVKVPKIVMEELSKGKILKGDLITVSQLAGIIGAKKTSEILPLCHPIRLTGVNVDVIPDYGKDLIRVIASVKVSEEKTGVEMEALTAATLSALNIYDMCKYLSHDIIVKEIKLLEKTGGKSDYKSK